MLQRVVKECAKKPDYKQTIISLTDQEKIDPQFKELGVGIICLGMSSILTVPLALYNIVRIFRKVRPNSVFTWMYHADLLGGLAAYFCGIKNIIWGIRNTQIPQKGITVTSSAIKICSLLSYHIPRKIICCAEAAKLAHIELGYCSEKMLVISNGYDLSSFKPSAQIRSKVRIELGLNDKIVVIGTIGRFDVLKDFHNFVKAASIVSKSISDVRFFMIGRGLEVSNHELMSWINETECADSFILFGECQPHDLLAAMDLYCLPSKAEGFPNVVAEAMAMKVPCVVTDVGDAALIVQNSGEVVSAMNSQELADALIRMLKLDSIERNKLGNNARSLIESKYSIERIAEEYMAFVL
jgi:glycosyltransferase involved in cell wall biosynthesis